MHGTKATDMSGDQTKDGIALIVEFFCANNHADSNFKRITD